MPRAFLPLVALVGILLAFASSASAGTSRTFVLRGHGWGHAIGMGQWGAYGYALNHGWSYSKILNHYYPGTSVGHVATTRRVRVLLTSGRTSFTLGSASPITVGGQTFPAGTYTVRRNAAHTRIRFAGKSFTSPATFRSSSTLRVDRSPFRGTIQVYLSGRLSVVNSLRVDDYVRGVIANEMPWSWHQEALRAQAVAARSYGLAVGGHCGNGVIGANVLCRSVSDQVYNGVASEKPSTNASVTATAREVRRFGGELAVTYFSSSSGGLTASVADEWGDTTKPYLASVVDEGDAISIHHNWGPGDPEVDCVGTTPDCVWRGSSLARRLGLGALNDLRVVSRNGSRRVARADADTGSSTRSYTGAELRTKLGLRSTWFSIGALRLATNRARVVFGKRVRVDTLVRGVANTTLQRRRSGESWTNLDSARGIESRLLKPAKTTSYRLRSGPVSTARRRVVVAAAIYFSSKQPAAGALRGTVRPLSLAGQTVFVDRRRADGTWRAGIASATLRADGSWRAAFTVRPGVYRARIVPPRASGLAMGLSPTLTVRAG
jgi:stage II sporulation protein D